MPVPEEVVPADEEYVLDIYFGWDNCGLTRGKLKQRGNHVRSSKFSASVRPKERR